MVILTGGFFTDDEDVALCTRNANKMVVRMVVEKGAARKTGEDFAGNKRKAKLG